MNIHDSKQNVSKDIAIIKIKEYNAQLKENIEVIKFLLDPLQFWCLLKIFKLQRPVSPGRLYSECTRTLYLNWRQKKVLEADSKKVKEMEELQLEHPNNDYESEHYRKEGQRIHDVCYNVSKAFDDWLLEYPPYEPIPQKELKRIEQELRKEKVKFPSNAKIVSTLKVLEDWGLLKEIKPIDTSRAKVLYTIHPEFYLAYGKSFSEKFKEMNDERILLEHNTL
ncbi:MAG: hypothetical protein Q7R96_04650 [Nanoarchaeota archaeon]|nr:hypothetical protein [Nanoarchaeota archaeon]